MNIVVYNVQFMNTQDREETLTLELLQTIDQQKDVTQRHLANHMGVALGLANSYLKRCVRKGLVKIHQVPANRYLYYLTPKGFAEKSRLTAKYLSISFDFYRNASRSLSGLFTLCEQKGYEKILFCGVSELAEIASIRILEHKLKLIGTFDPGATSERFIHLPVWIRYDVIEPVDACIVTALENPQLMYEQARAGGAEVILVPDILGIKMPEN